ncbi:membrane protein [Sulfurifustis variabilis]|uniref:Membrane protein n=1 Tax=Sulfurifustis variabilis TaxID=1675686 RepID=A0A1B4VC87_9GAMM|nr:DedA family protein [Sulfurifustis variabilis]BAU48911.1 membrane protein [Sulfurifustis variabilis]
MALDELIANYGYLAILVGTFLEGETILVLGGLAAHLGFLELPWVIAAAFAGSFSGDQLYFYVGRRYGPRILAKRLSWQEGAEKVYRHLRRHQNFLILTFRFYYGLRNVTPFAIGASQVSRLRFLVLNLTGAVVWAITLGALGFLFGEAFRLFLEDVKHYEFWLLGGLILVGTAIWAFTLVRHRRRSRRHPFRPEVMAADPSMERPKDPEGST